MNEESLCIKRSFSKRKNKRRDKFVLSNSCKGIYRYKYIYMYTLLHLVLYIFRTIANRVFILYTYTLYL